MTKAAIVVCAVIALSAPALADQPRGPQGAPAPGAGKLDPNSTQCQKLKSEMKMKMAGATDARQKCAKHMADREACEKRVNDYLNDIAKRCG